MENLEKSVEQALKNNLVTIVVGENEIEARSAAGYRLVEIIYKDNLLPVYENTYEKDGVYGQNKMTHETTKSIPVREPRFVMVLSAYDALVGKQERIRELEELVRDADRSTAEATKSADQQHQRASRLGEDLTRSAESLRVKSDAIHALENRNRKFEIDMGKMRTALGDLRMKEILGRMNDEDLLRYFEIHSRTERALFHRDHVQRLLNLAGVTANNVTDREWWSLHFEDADPLVKKARERISLGLGSVSLTPHDEEMVSRVSEAMLRKE